MAKPIIVFLLRALVGLAGGWLLTNFFLTPKGQPLNWLVVIILAVMVVAAAYLSEAWRLRKQTKK